MTSGSTLRLRDSIRHAVVPQEAADRRFDMLRRREMRRFVTVVLGIQIIYAAIGAITGGPGALSSDRIAASWLGAGLIAVSIALVILVRWSTRLAVVEAIAFAAGTLGIGVCLLGQLLDPETAVAVALYEGVIMGVIAFAMPWGVFTHFLWLAVAAALAVTGLVASVPPGPLRDAVLGGLVFAVVMSGFGKVISWNERVVRHLQQVEVRRLNAGLRLASRIDGGTGLFNRRALTELLARLATRRGGRIGFAMIDIDHFKAVNDSRGHQAGDAVLRTVAEAVASEVRDVDQVFRYGGEEFLAVFGRTESGGPALAGKRIRAAIEALRLPNEAVAHGVLTVSIGTAEVSLPASLEALTSAIAVADARLYEAKRAGRNRVVS